MKLVRYGNPGKEKPGLIDANGLQGFGPTESVLRLEPLRLKWGAFGFRTSEIDGHDFEQIHAAFAEPSDARPHCIIARTVKGKGVSFMENKPEFHGIAPNAEQAKKALAEIGASAAVETRGRN